MAPVTIVAALFCIAEVLLALAGVEPISRHEDPYVGFTSYLPLFVDGYDESGTSIKRTAENKLRYFNAQQFLAEEPENGYRIFCLGGSTTFGHPYDDATSFSGWLRAFLPKADPVRHWEVVNCGGISYASYRLALMMEELCTYEPDLFIVYTGHNEFLERRAYQGIVDTSPAERWIGTTLAKTRVYSAVKRLVDRRTKRSNERLLPAEVDTILDNSAGPEFYHRDDAYRALVEKHFEFNLNRMAELAREAGASIIFVTPASNLLDCSPFKSEHPPRMPAADLERCVESMRAARSMIAKGDFANALPPLNEALAIDDRFAETYYLRGQVFWHLAEYDDARRAFDRARDEDICPLRATGPLIDALRRVAKSNDVPLIDFARTMDESSDNGIPGNDWFLDHVHPTIEGHRRLALSILDRLIAGGIAHPSDEWGPGIVAQLQSEVEGQIDAVAQGQALLTVGQVYMWGGKYDEARVALDRALELSPDDWLVYYVLATWAQVTRNIDEAIVWQRQAVERNPDEELLQRQLDELMEMQAERGDGQG